MSKEEKILKLQSIASQHQKNGLRRGQSLMNALWEVCPDLYSDLNMSIYDCFYNDEIVSSCWERIMEEVKDV